eukprot:TRINITY_DN43567_c0_g1_i1.p1 TRINITY_DN43567_c0_g1~~TRINITY_DN43567_c0_g1_i1.p1  ORF type:complete len:277 (+),score=35.77 TRINITY_DN43567_c0_g1_i1:81-911(+)
MVPNSVAVDEFGEDSSTHRRKRWKRGVLCRRQRETNLREGRLDNAPDGLALAQLTSHLSHLCREERRSVMAALSPAVRKSFAEYLRGLKQHAVAETCRQSQTSGERGSGLDLALMNLEDEIVANRSASLAESSRKSMHSPALEDKNFGELTVSLSPKLQVQKHCRSSHIGGDFDDATHEVVRTINPFAEHALVEPRNFDDTVALARRLRTLAADDRRAVLAALPQRTCCDLQRFLLAERHRDAAKSAFIDRQSSTADLLARPVSAPQQSTRTVQNV